MSASTALVGAVALVSRRTRMSALSRSQYMKPLVSLVAVSLVLPTVASLAQRSAAPAENFRTLATFTEYNGTDPHVSPDGRFVLVATPSELRVYDVATKATRKLVDGMSGDLEWSSKGDRIAWSRLGEDRRTWYVWSMPLDPKTARPTGPAQRVSKGEGQQRTISLDGRWLAYSAPDSNAAASVNGFRGAHLSVVPITGGPERVIAHFMGEIDYVRWSADGKSLYVNGVVVGGKQAVVTKVFIDGRAPEVIRPGNGEWLTGMTSDRRHLVLVPAKGRVAAGDRAIIIDTTGREVGRVPLPVGMVTEYDDVLGDSALVWVAFKDSKRIEIRSMKGGQPIKVPLVGEADDSPLWSPDGKRIAFLAEEENHLALAVMNADGTGVRVFRDTDLRDVSRAARWSPDSKYILISSRDRHRLLLLDVATNAVRTIISDPTVGVGNRTWRADSRSLNAVLRRDPESQSSIEEITLTGARRKLLDREALPSTRTFEFVSDSTIYSRTESASFLVSLAGGAPRKLADVPANTRMRAMAVSHDRQWVAGPLDDAAHPEVHQLELTSLSSGARRVVEVPFGFAWTEPRFTPDDRSLVMHGWAPGDSTGATLFVVPLEGGTPRAIAKIGNPLGSTLSVSPDGASVAYTVQDNRTSSLLLIDLRPALSGISLAPSSP